MVIQLWIVIYLNEQINEGSLKLKLQKFMNFLMIIMKANNMPIELIKKEGRGKIYTQRKSWQEYRIHFGIHRAPASHVRYW